MNAPEITPKRLLLIACILCLAMLLPAAAFSAELTIGWNKPDSSQVDGYNIYYGESMTDFKSVPGQSIENPDTTQLTISGLYDGATYAFTVTSVDTFGNESDFSDVLAVQVPLPADNDDDDGDTYTEREGDCDDNDASVYPGATEICGDGIDQDCNGSDLSCSDAAAGAGQESASDSDTGDQSSGGGGGGGGGGCFIKILWPY